MWPDGMNYVAVAAAGVAYFIFGAVWYGALAKPWMVYSGKTEEEVQAGAGAPTYIVAALTSFLAALALAAIIKLAGAASFADAICVAGTCGVGLVGSAIAKHYAFQGYKPGLLLIDAGYDVVGFVLMACIIHALG